MDLPQEIINSIIFHLRYDRTTLRALSLVCSTFLPESRRYLYQKIALARFDQRTYIPHECFTLELNRNTELFTTLSQRNPSIASYIHTFAYVFDPSHGDKEDICEWLNVCLQLMTNLKDLSFLFVRLPLARLVQGCTFELETFRYGPWVTKWSSESTDLYDFITSQCTLRKLMFIEFNPHGGDFKKFLWPHTTFFPQLKHLIGTALIIEHILPTCSPTSLSWVMFYGGDFYHVPNLGQKLEDMKSLCLHGGHIPVETRERMVAPLPSYCRHLQILHISGYLSEKFLSTNFSEVPHFPNLKIFIQSLPIPVSWQVWNKIRGDLATYLESRRLEVVAWFQELHHLQVAYFQQLPITEAKCFVAYERGVSEPIEVEAAEVWEISPWI